VNTTQKVKLQCCRNSPIFQARNFLARELTGSAPHCVSSIPTGNHWSIHECLNNTASSLREFFQAGEIAQNVTE